MELCWNSGHPNGKLESNYESKDNDGIDNMSIRLIQLKNKSYCFSKLFLQQQLMRKRALI